ncbi:PcfJ domain-containing protein [Acidithiobacillus ferrivorans]|uniref:Uncharacterized protein n=1 Tax=Acidithiobacillus ferrivorans TaxID=160808 RepID=A0A060UQB8_9PROT|nr:PcfJ domain-containing protein [Acidithiobacillus ferrivorans]CDQ10456.1 conserved hypothetical protein [Acidithiobacillus ferrivorans]
MQHCVYTYVPSCADGISRIFSVAREDGRRLSTLELRVQSGHFVVSQNLGFRNASVSASLKRAVDQWVQALNAQKARLVGA